MIHLAIKCIPIIPAKNKTQNKIFHHASGLIIGSLNMHPLTGA